MEAKFFSEVEKKIDVKTLKDFEKEVRTKINNEFESLRKKNDNLSRILMAGECDMWEKIKNEDYSWLQINSDKKKKLYRLIDIYSKFDDIVDSVKYLHYGTAPVDTRRPQNRGSHDYLRAHKGSRRMSRPLIQDSSVRVLFPQYKGNLT